MSDEAVNDKIFFIKAEMSSIIHAATAGITSDDYQQKIIPRIHELKQTRWELLLELVVLIPIAVIVISASVYFQIEGFAYLSIVFLYILLQHWLLELMRYKRKRRFLSAALRADDVRPNVCVCCYIDLRGVTAGTCPQCGEALAPVSEEKR